ncbi:MAG: phenylacetate-CoA oxygenase/reductase subunit PaaK [Flavobacteriaceae bacterium]|nr:phenylacetate-CoA oxygenase/reductase subunit PaaK [Bacteroidia bacterium]MBT8268222.1 phenylacetate-CoA oxygenase/reductase subunit PaaK [Bacteroidia bacterium]MBT8287229.1 phenylacetate-CoA oxygenase/reductase subunit PaaK [Bacteroidia bacterium]NNF75587.1 phenylacetate-CoA oxygenase/reductase subunit PaaK [Flavobacteriaceae bacterium]NNK73589.1 phenylacetate-CoA oxygenase/reductase subunit PaaK [Flavobacteriaceae bacterium]
MTDIYTVKIADLYKETKDTVVLTFDIPEELHETLRFIQGQHLILRKTIDGEDVRRTYSLCTSPDDNIWKVAIKHIPGGVFSTYANKSLKKGDTIDIMKPSGNFFVKTNPEHANNYIAFAAGSGITPIISMIKTHLEREPNSTFKLFYLNKTTKSIIFKEEIERLKNLYFQRFHVFYFLTKEQRDIEFLNGRFDKEKMEILTNNFIDIEDTAHCFLCGPKDMIFLIQDELIAAGMPKKNIHYELFFSGDAEVSDLQFAETLDKMPDGTVVTIIDGGKEFHFTMDDGYQTLLDGALAEGADLPFACKGGVCSTCRCKVIEGEVKMKVNYALEQHELDQNLVLSCQAVPISDKIIVDFDI